MSPLGSPMDGRCWIWKIDLYAWFTDCITELGTRQLFSLGTSINATMYYYWAFPTWNKFVSVK